MTFKDKPRIRNIYTFEDYSIKIVDRNWDIAVRRYNILRHHLLRREGLTIPDSSVLSIFDGVDAESYRFDW